MARRKIVVLLAKKWSADTITFVEKELNFIRKNRRKLFNFRIYTLTKNTIQGTQKLCLEKKIDDSHEYIPT